MNTLIRYVVLSMLSVCMLMPVLCANRDAQSRVQEDMEQAINTVTGLMRRISFAEKDNETFRVTFNVHLELVRLQREILLTGQDADRRLKDVSDDLENLRMLVKNNWCFDSTALGRELLALKNSLDQYRKLSDFNKKCSEAEQHSLGDRIEILQRVLTDAEADRMILGECFKQAQQRLQSLKRQQEYLLSVGQRQQANDSSCSNGDAQSQLQKNIEQVVDAVIGLMRVTSSTEKDAGLFRVIFNVHIELGRLQREILLSTQEQTGCRLGVVRGDLDNLVVMAESSPLLNSIPLKRELLALKISLDRYIKVHEFKRKCSEAEQCPLEKKVAILQKTLADASGDKVILGECFERAQQRCQLLKCQQAYLLLVERGQVNQAQRDTLLQIVSQLKVSPDMLADRLFLLSLLKLNVPTKPVLNSESDEDEFLDAQDNGGPFADEVESRPNQGAALEASLGGLGDFLNKFGIVGSSASEIQKDFQAILNSAELRGTEAPKAILDLVSYLGGGQ